MKILLTGFEPFADHKVNPSQLLISKLPDHYQGKELIKDVLPVHHQHGSQKLLNLLTSYQPDAVVSFGLASGCPHISLERVAINLMDFRIADNTGTIIEDQPVHEDGPAAFFSTLPLKSIRNALTEVGIPAHISLSAGAYLCNQVFYTMMHAINTIGLNTKAGFIHLPDLPQQAAQDTKPLPSMSFDLMLKAVYLIIEQLN